MPQPAASDKATVRSVSRALSLLDAVDIHGQTLTGLAHHVKLSVPTALRLLRALEETGYVRRAKDGRYFPGGSAVRLAHAVDPHGAIRWRVRESLERVRDRLKETVTFQIREGRNRVCIEAASGHHSVRHLSTPGERERIYRGASGKILLTFGTDADIDVLVPVKNGMYELAEGRLRPLEELRTELVKVRRLGFAVSKGETSPDLAGVSVPVYFGEAFVGALSVGFPRLRFNQEIMMTAAQACLEEAARIKTNSEQPGFSMASPAIHVATPPQKKSSRS